jgi:hypothetical protein
MDIDEVRCQFGKSRRNHPDAQPQAKFHFSAGLNASFGVTLDALMRNQQKSEENSPRISTFGVQ